MNKEEFEEKFVFYDEDTRRRLIRANDKGLYKLWQWIEDNFISKDDIIKQHDFAFKRGQQNLEGEIRKARIDEISNAIKDSFGSKIYFQNRLKELIK